MQEVKSIKSWMNAFRQRSYVSLDGKLQHERKLPSPAHYLVRI